MSTTTVRCALHNRSWVIRKVEIVVAHGQECALQVAQHHHHWIVHDWYRMIFCDEIKINQF